MRRQLSEISTAGTAKRFTLLATHNTPPAFAEERRSVSPLSAPIQNTLYGRMAATKSVVHIADLRQSRLTLSNANSRIVAAVELGGVRTLLVVPMLKENELIGVFFCFARKSAPLPTNRSRLVKNFAAQAVIAIENARLLKRTARENRTGGSAITGVVKLNQQLEQRVTDQVGEIERMSRLRRFLPPQVADLIVASGSEKQLESHRREITALFCDLRGFTGFTESADAEDVMALLRDYHAAIGEIIIKYNGTLERYAGDGVMVVFNDPVPVENPALQAVLMALEVRDAIGALTETWRRLGHDIGFGIGIAHGFATLGTIGFEGRFDYAAIGTVSNVASRLCDEAKPGQILISPRVLMKVENAVKVEPVGEFELKGIRRPLAAYNVLTLCNQRWPKEASVYASIRQGKAKAGMAEELTRRIKEGAIPIISDVEGFMAYYVVYAPDDTVTAISIFKDYAGAEESNKRALAWIEQSLTPLLAEPATAIAGPVIEV